MGFIMGFIMPAFMSCGFGIMGLVPGRLSISGPALPELCCSGALIDKLDFRKGPRRPMALLCRKPAGFSWAKARSNNSCGSASGLLKLVRWHVGTGHDLH